MNRMLVEDDVYEQALHARIMQRCRRAFLHEVRNGLQPMHAGLEALSRVLVMTPAPLDKAQRYVQLVRQASSSQEQALERAIERIAPDNTAEQVFDIATLVREVTRFLSSDAAVAGVRMQVDLPAALNVKARPHQLRLILLACTLDAIDSAGNEGQLTIAGQAAGEYVLLQFTDTRSMPADFDANCAGEQATDGQLHLYVAKRLLERVNGDLDCMVAPQGGYAVAISLPTVEQTAGV